LWGFWGVFFAIPLATLVKAVINAWPKKVHPQPGAATPNAEPGPT
jgi:putative permease